MNCAIAKSNFILTSFNRDNKPTIEIIGAVSKADNCLNIEYLLTGNLSKIIVPQPEKTLRQSELWEHTCFELFIKLKNSSKYWEFNFSPSRNWNVFRFLDYRLNIVEEKAFDSLPFDVSQNINCLQLKAHIDLDRLEIADKDLEIAISAVIENRKQKLSYWALNHPAAEADFHHPDSFTISF